ncbi:BT4734/BF3469 family protein [Nodosilinea sp. FACHB-13]|uniref:BT4734/BF3469 family protein n=1 Tax=Cyanophyceae TaxID=3028117 RepID=UPI0016842A0F|nr:BT4734/BF3469 family protein [Nodosilinea sp. FACHB-13]MBD2107468.1 hypothetical protein [Nodosilinea sp. FACHB-13]
MKSILESPVSVFKFSHENSTVPAHTTAILDALDSIRTNEQAKIVRDIYQKEGKSKHYKAEKKKLPGITWAGTFPIRKDDCIDKVSGVMYLDKDELDITLDQIVQYPEVVACWKSVSGAGYGFLAFYEGNYKSAFRELSIRFEARGIKLDPQCSNIGRLNFLSYDPELWIREDWESCPVVVGPEPELGEIEDIPTGTFAATLEEVIENCIGYANDRAGKYEEGNRYNYSIYLACKLIHYGVPLSEVFSDIEKFIPDITDDTLERINDLYHRWADQYGTWSYSTTNYDEYWVPVIYKYNAPENAIVLNQEYTSNYPVENHPKLGIKAAKGTGKTTLIKRWVNQFNDPKMVLVVSNRQSIVDKLVNDLGFVDYRNVKGGDYRRGGRYVICINSIPHIPAEMRSGCVTIIDEVESTLNDLTLSSTFGSNRNEVRMALEEMVSTCEGLLYLDADISEATYNYINELTEGGEFLVNMYQPLAHKGKAGGMTNLEIRTSKNMEAVLTDLDNTIKCRTPFIYCDLAATVTILGTIYPEFDAITSDTKANYPQIFNDPDNYRPAGSIGSPSVATAISLTNGHFNFVGGIYQLKLTTIEMFAQGLHRVRSGCDRVVWCVSTTNPKLAKTEAECLADILSAQQKVFDLNDVPKKAVATPFDRLKAAMMAKNSRQHAFPLQAMREKFRAEGYFVTETELLDGEMTELDIIYKQAKEFIKVSKIESIINAEDVDIEVLQEKKELTPDESASLIKCLIRRSLVINDVIKEDVKFYQKDDNWQAIRLVEYLNDPKLAEQKDEWQKDYYAPDKDFCLDTVRLACDLNLGYFRDNAQSITVEDIKELVEVAREHSADIKLLFGIDISKLKKENAIARKILACVGLKVVSKRHYADGKEFQIPEVNIDEYFEEVIQRRELKRAEVQVVPTKDTLDLGRPSQLKEALSPHYFSDQFRNELEDYFPREHTLGEEDDDNLIIEF